MPRLLILVALFVTPSVTAQYTFSVDLLSPGEPGYDGLPPTLLCVDIHGSWPLGDGWASGVVRGLVSEGAALRYAPDPNDPDVPVLFNPGLSNRYTTCFSRARSRNGGARFTNAGARPAGAYNPPAVDYVATSEQINIAYFSSPPETGLPVSEGYFARIALDVSGVPGGPAAIDDWFAGPIEDAPDHAVFVFRSEPAAGFELPGSAYLTFDEPAELRGASWGVWFIPEPSAIVLLLAGAAVALTPRR